ncbi:MAG: hypothetical protein ACRC0F_08300 [Cetobacterium sp.]
MGDSLSEVTDYIEQFEKLSKTYRMGCEFEQVGPTDFIPIKGSPIIYCYGGKVAIYPKTLGVVEAHILTSINFENRFKALGVTPISFEVEDEGGIKTCSQFGECGEFTLAFNIEDLDKVAELFKIRGARNKLTTPYTTQGINDFLRFSRNIHDRYNDILKERFIKDI